MYLMNQTILNIGVLVLFIGIALIFFGSMSGKTDPNTKVAIGGVIGFIPFGFGNDKKMVIAMIAVSVLLFVIWNVFARIR